uniref:General transcription factor IIH subunit 3 n=1 Tax=Globodera pallida TaxID=36090 RepID=A0A183C439_GLOPA
MFGRFEMSDGGNISFLCVIIDCNAYNWGSVVAEHGLSVLNETIAALIALFSTEPNPYNLSNSLSLGICAFQRFKKRFAASFGHIVFINLSREFSSEQNSLLNLFFASRQYSLHFHVASFHKTVPILQQASDITGGAYIHVINTKLVTAFVATRMGRRRLVDWHLATLITVPNVIAMTNCWISAGCAPFVSRSPAIACLFVKSAMPCSRVPPLRTHRRKSGKQRSNNK